MDIMHFVFFYVIGYILAVIIHELGHLSAARLANLPVPEFSIGWGPVIFKYHILTIRLLPFCGFCQIVDEDFKLSSISKERGGIVLAGGIVFNLIVAVLTIILTFTIVEIPLFLLVFISVNFTLAILNSLPVIKSNDGWKIKNYWEGE